MFAAELPSACQSECATPHGQVLGQSPRGIAAYSNCKSDCVVFEPNRHDGTFTGIKWQCVEYARRWLLLNRGVVYGDVDVAADIWDKVDYYRQLEWDEKIPVENLVNGSSKAPQAGDLLIYARVMFGGTGHVAVVTGIDKDKGVVRVAEQNFNNLPWSGTHARELPLLHKNGGYWILDAYLLGWKRMQQPAS
jgi:glutathionylspermidine amidase/synthetase